MKLLAFGPSIVSWLAVIQLSTSPAVAESTSKPHTCSPEKCVKGLYTQVGAQISHPQIHLFPGTYSSKTSTDLVALLPKSTFTTPKPSNNSADSEFDGPQILFGNTYLQAFKGSTVNLKSVGSAEWEIVVDRQPDVQWFKDTSYLNTVGSTHLGDVAVISGNNSVAHIDAPVRNASNTPKKWSSLLLPAGTYIQFTDPSRSAASSSAPRSLLIRGSVANKAALSRDVFGQGWSMDLDSLDWTRGSDACQPACSAVGGMCLPSSSAKNITSSRAASRAVECRCAKGFSGPTCSTCDSGYFGPTCQSCPRQCFDEKTGAGRCDDGVTGSGGCRGVLGNSSLACRCSFGTCTSSNSCECSAGWTTPANASSEVSRCSVCREGWYLDMLAGDCLACPLGATTCTSAVLATGCIKGWTIDSTGKCAPAGPAASCVEGQYWDGSSCSACSPACQTCTGPSSSDCIKCASPRANLLGMCVPYDAATGICDTSDAQIDGSYILVPAKGRCDSCPQGCFACSIPGFSVTSDRQDLQCTACQEGWVLQGGACVQSCGVGHYLPSGSSSINGTCQPCDPAHCSQCTTSATQCTVCADSTKYATPAGNCVNSCPDGTFLSAPERRCQSCPADCATCSPWGQCLTCPSTFPVLDRTSGRCTGGCPASTFWQGASATCEPCFANCTSCTGPQAGQCLSCAEGSILKGGACEHGVCDVVADLGICLQDDNDNGNTWWPWLLSVMLFVTICATIAWCVFRSKRQRQGATAAFAATLDDKAINKRLAGGIFHILNPNKTHNRTPSRESFLPASTARQTYREPIITSAADSTDDASPYHPTGPPAYQSQIDLTFSDVKGLAKPDVSKVGPRRAPFNSRLSINDSVNIYDGGKRPFTNRIQPESDYDPSDAQEGNWTKEDSSDIHLHDRNSFRIV